MRETPRRRFIRDMRTIAHIGIPTDRVPEKGTYLAGAKLYVSDPADTKNNLEFLYFEEGSPMPEVIQKRTHIAYFVDDLDAELKAAKKVLVPPFEPFPHIKAAFVEEDGIGIELLQKF